MPLIMSKKKQNKEEQGKSRYGIIRPGSFAYYKPAGTIESKNDVSTRSENNHSSASYILAITILAAVLLVLAWIFIEHTNSSFFHKSPKGQATKPVTEQNSIGQASSITVVVNKHRRLSPKTYAPTRLVVPNIPLRANITSTERYVSSVMAGPLQTMVKAAKEQGVNLNLQSGYRSYNFQVDLYNSYVQQQGQAAADEQSARPGYSEHQTGLAADLGSIANPACNVAQCFATTTEGKWLAGNAYKYGFIVRYPKNKQQITGYEYEPWHIRYVGAKLSTEMHRQGITTLEEFFGLPAAPNYN